MLELPIEIAPKPPLYILLSMLVDTFLFSSTLAEEWFQFILWLIHYDFVFYSL